ncbi:MAG: high frequency lysogenization protein HflD [Pseudomonadales bacterium]
MQYKDQLLALGAMLQAVELVDQLATTGSADNVDFKASIQQLFIFEPDDAQAAFAGTDALRSGLRLLSDLLNRRREASKSGALNYAMGILHLEKKLAKQPEMLNIIRSRLQHASFHKEHFSANSDSVIHPIAAIYQDTLSTFRYRIQVNGNLQHLRDERIADSIRALLLVAIRAARLWRLYGGRRLNLILQRKKLEQSLSELLQA